MQTEIHSIEALLAHLAAHGNLNGVVIQGLDLRAHGEALRGIPLEGAVFLGCRMDERAMEGVALAGAMIFPVLDGLPFKPYRASLYTLDELMEGYQRGVVGSFHQDARDSLIYHHFQRFRKSTGLVPIIDALAIRLHDHAIDDALDDLFNDPDQPRRVVAIMGGHAMTRDEAIYAQVAVMARALAREGFFVSTGGGPGAMEAANLGAWFAPYPDEDLTSAIALLARVPSYKLEGYLEAGFEVLDRWPDGGESLAIPTWFYGHEPTNQFSSHIAKYFSNSLREDGLLAIATYGVIYAPGAAGTVQEVFMDATQNHYGTFKVVSPMVFFGQRYWTERYPLYPLITQLAHGRQYADMLALSDDLDEIVQFILDHPPVEYHKHH